MKRISNVVAASLIILLPACSQTAPGTAKPAATPSSAKSSVNCETASQSEWLKNCAGKDSSGVEAEPAIKATPLGSPFDYTQVYTDDPKPRTWKVTLTKAEWAHLDP